MADRRTDAQIVAALQVFAKNKNNQRLTASELGIARATLQDTLRDAEQRGLTAESRVSDPLVRLQIENQGLKQRVKELEREEDSAARIREEIYKIAAYDPDPPKWLVKNGKNGFRGMPTIFGSDWHYGERVRSREVGGVNEFNSDIAATRIRKMAERTVDLAFNHMGKAATVYPGIVFALGGDLMSGRLHPELVATDDRTPQQCINELTDLIGGCIDLFATKFGNVFVPAVTGNHGRSTIKPVYKQRVFTSHEWNIYCNLAREWRRTKSVQFLIPEGADCRWNVYDHRYMMTHGDNLGVKGGDGMIGMLGPIRRGEIKIRGSESKIGRDFDTLIMGHWHDYVPLPGLIVNNALKGFDEYAHLALRAKPSRPSQAMWFTHPEHGITAHWQVYVDDKPKLAEEVPFLSWPGNQ